LGKVVAREIVVGKFFPQLQRLGDSVVTHDVVLR
jgi:hypothetical protein